MVYVDESGMDERDNYGYGWSKKGERIHGLKAGRRQGRINMIAGYRDGKLIAPWVRPLYNTVRRGEESRTDLACSRIDPKSRS